MLKEPDPVEKEPISVEKKPTPFEKEPIPVEKEPTAFEKEPVPIEKEPIPVEKEPTLVPGKGDESYDPAQQTALQEKIEALASQPECARLTSKVSSDLGVSLSGYVSSPEDLEWLRSRLGTLDQIRRLKEDVSVYQRPFCRVVGALLDGGQGTDRVTKKPLITLNNPSSIYREGEFLVLHVRGDNAADGYLYVDYVDSVGDVVHLYPTPSADNNPVPAGAEVVLGGGDEGRRYEIAPPHGRNMILAIWSRHPLLSQLRPGVEAIGDYLPVLELAMERSKGYGHNQFASSFKFIETRE